jgi:hypothetical protein
MAVIIIFLSVRQLLGSRRDAIVVEKRWKKKAHFRY